MGSGDRRHRNKQPLSHEEEIKIKNPKLNNPDMRSYKGWNRPDATWHAASYSTDKVKIGEHKVSRPPKNPGAIQGIKLTMIPLWAWTVYILCKIMIGAIKGRRIQKSNQGVNKMRRITKQNQRPIMDTNKEELKRPTVNDSQGTIATGTTGAGTTTSHDTNLGAGKTHWVNIR